MKELSGSLVTVRTAKQGAEMMLGKATDNYLLEIATLRLHKEDLARLGLFPGDRALIVSMHGQAEVVCREADVPEGLFFLPLGQVANQLFSAAATHGTGVPEWKLLEVRVSAVGRDGAQL